jgi:DNA polymerase
VKRVEIEPTFEAWQAAARRLLREGVAPAEITWSHESLGQPALLDLTVPSPAAPGPPAVESPLSSGAETDLAVPVAPGATGNETAVRVPRRFLELARRVAASPEPTRWRLLYEALWRLVHERHDLLDAESDPLVSRLARIDPGAAPFVPAGADLPALQAAAARCQGCDLHRAASQTVFGRGAADARVVLVGEQPGDQEDRQGAPFVGPAGEVLDRALAEAGLDRERLYVTNAVKHFKFEPRGRRRIHQTPRAPEIAACRPWLEAELALINPEVLVCLGATAARALLGPDFRIMRDRGIFRSSRWSAKTVATFHPSAVLRGEDDAAQARLYGLLVGDLRLVAASISGSSNSAA